MTTSTSKMSNNPREFILGTRKSPLALVQANHVSALLSASHPTLSFPIQTVIVQGDIDKTTPFLQMESKISSDLSQSQTTSSNLPTLNQQNIKKIASDAAKNIWLEEMENMLRKGELDILQHCLKDMPTTLPKDFILAAVMQRVDPTDAVVMPLGYTNENGLEGLDGLPDGAVIGTSSTRRKALLKRLWPGLDVKECRGNMSVDPMHPKIMLFHYD